MPDHTRDLNHTARLIALLHAEDLGYLKHHTCQEIADQFGLNRSTISRDLRSLEQLRRLVGVNEIKLKNLP